ncbi:uncharacterized protein LOC131875182 [Cryptomeria japonica]|uniref:uncharacterized protein LOC131875182 n=1 Tax=Cryptomeria japonica TaxID=3369 RepID=UPI0027DA4627|nr:uncharacterized protein LOC131875182 [Cryptomeria japonica]
MYIVLFTWCSGLGLPTRYYRWGDDPRQHFLLRPIQRLSCPDEPVPPFDDEEDMPQWRSPQRRRGGNGGGGGEGGGGDGGDGGGGGDGGCGDVGASSSGW